jgi:hypothetical protein
VFRMHGAWRVPPGYAVIRFLIGFSIPLIDKDAIWNTD